MFGINPIQNSAVSATPMDFSVQSNMVSNPVSQVASDTFKASDGSTGAQLTTDTTTANLTALFSSLLQQMMSSSSSSSGTSSTGSTNSTGSSSSGVAVSSGGIDAVGQAAAKFGYSHGASTASAMEKNGAGDCWAMSDFINKNLQSQGIQSRVIQYGTSMSSNHRSVQIFQNGKWVDFDYGKYGINKLFKACHKGGFSVVSS